MYVYIYACMYKFCHTHIYMAKLDRNKKRNKFIIIVKEVIYISKRFLNYLHFKCDSEV